jgi:hypothetical protein
MADTFTLLPPYMSFGVFRTTIDTLAESTVPTGPLDRRVLDGLSGADYGALMSGLKFLGYVDSDRKATELYRTLVKASKKPDAFKPALLSVLEPAYKPIIGNIDLKHGTITELEKAFKEAGVSPGQMLAPRKKRATNGDDDSDTTTTDPLPTGAARLPIPGLQDAYIQYPVGLTEANCDLFDAMLTALRTYAKSRVAGKEKK